MDTGAWSRAGQVNTISGLTLLSHSYDTQSRDCSVLRKVIEAVETFFKSHFSSPRSSMKPSIPGIDELER